MPTPHNAGRTMRMQSNTPSRKVATLKMTQAVVQWLSKASPRVENAIAIVTPKNKAHWAHSLLDVPMLMGSGASAGFVWCVFWDMTVFRT